MESQSYRTFIKAIFVLTDYNECGQFNTCDPATSTSVNTDGSYHCECKPGFKYAYNGLLCDDRNECVEKIALCEQTCVNTRGSYTCSCNSGFTLSADGKTCDGILNQIFFFSSLTHFKAMFLFWGH